LILRELAQLVKVPDSPYKEWMFRCDPVRQSKKDAKAQDTFWNKRREELSKKFANIAKVKFEKVSRTTMKREVVVSVKSSSRSRRGKFEFKPIDKETVDKMVDDEAKRPKYKDSTLHNAMLRLFQEQGVVTVQCLRDALSDRGFPLDKFDQVLNDIAIEIPTQERYVRSVRARSARISIKSFSRVDTRISMKSFSHVETRISLNKKHSKLT
tara:strand:+ start:185 stop:817 length:633 start_codon:yes stop_codon:yes gene_type:complete